MRCVSLNHLVIHLCDDILLLVCAVVNVNFVSMSYSVGEGEGDVEVCARMVGLNAIDVVVTMSTNDSTAKCEPLLYDGHWTGVVGGSELRVAGPAYRLGRVDG